MYKVANYIAISIIAITISIATPSLASTPPLSAGKPVILPKAPQLTAKNYLIMDYYSDKILASKAEHTTIAPASLTKMMTIYVVDMEIKNNMLKLSDEVVVSKKAWQAPGSRMFIEVGSKVSVADLIKGIIIQSGNDASIALAEHVAGSESAFADLMNSYASLLGMQNSKFVNATGLPNKEHYSTAYDMAILAKAIIHDFPETYKLYAEKSFTYKNIQQFNRNRLLWRNPIIDGIKTGYTDTAGFCLIASAQKKNMRLISVVMGTKSDELRTNETNKLLNWGFRFFDTHQLYKANNTLETSPIWLGNTKQLNVGLTEDLYLTIPHGMYEKLNASISLPKIITAPLNKGDEVGQFIVKLNDEILVQEPIVALDQVTKGKLWNRIKDSVHLSALKLWEKFSE